MNDLNEMVKQYTVKYNRKINAITNPLKNCLGGNVSFTYTRTEQDGRYFSVSDHPGILGFYHAEKLYIDNPYCSLDHLWCVDAGRAQRPDQRRPDDYL